MDTIRVLRVVEYVGPRDLIEEHFRNPDMRAERKFGGPKGTSCTIRTATIGSYPEILDTFANGKTEVELPEVTGTLCSECGEPQLETSSGITCANGHGGAPPKCRS